MRTLFLVLYCTGLRLGEAPHLRVVDLDLQQACFRIRPSKGRVRLVPFGRDLAYELNKWLDVRRKTWFPFWLTGDERIYPRALGSPSFRIWSRAKAGAYPAEPLTGPKSPDLSHLRIPASTGGRWSSPPSMQKPTHLAADPGSELFRPPVRRSSRSVASSGPSLGYHAPY
jgi:hypothetical protein